MELKEIQEHLKLLIRSDLTKECIEISIEYVLNESSDIYNEFLLHSNKYRKIKRDDRKNILTYTEKSVHQARLADAILDAIDEFQEDDIKPEFRNEEALGITFIKKHEEIYLESQREQKIDEYGEQLADSFEKLDDFIEEADDVWDEVIKYRDELELKYPQDNEYPNLDESRKLFQMIYESSIDAFQILKIANTRISDIVEIFIKALKILRLEEIHDELDDYHEFLEEIREAQQDLAEFIEITKKEKDEYKKVDNLIIDKNLRLRVKRCESLFGRLIQQASAMLHAIGYLESHIELTLEKLKSNSIESSD